LTSFENTRKVNLALYLEGIRVPVVGATVTFGVNQPASANIIIPPISSSVRLKARTVAHLFFDDSTEDANVQPEDRFKLLFEGELLAWSYQKETTRRNIVLKCSDFSNWMYWIKPWQFMSKNFFTSEKTYQYVGQSDKPSLINYVDQLDLPGEFVSELSQHDIGVPGLINSVLFSSLNAFKWSRDLVGRTLLLNKIGGIYDEAYSELVDDYWKKDGKMLDMAFMSGVGVPIAQSLSRYLNSFNYHLVSNPVANMSPANFMLDETQGTSYTIGDFVIGNPEVDQTESFSIHQKSFLYVPEAAISTIPPRCNVIFPDQLMRMDTTRDFQKEITRLIAKWTPDPRFFNQDIFTMITSSPEELEDLVEGTTDRVKSRSSFSELTEEGNDERELGVLSEVISIDPFSSVALDAPRGDATQTLKDKYQDAVRHLVNLIFRKKKFSSRSLSATTVFNPAIVAGLPALILDTHLPILFTPIQCQHTITENEVATTSISGQFSRTIIEEGYKFVRKYSNALNWNYKPFYVGTDVYPKLLGFFDGNGCIAKQTGIWEVGNRYNRERVNEYLNTLRVNLDDTGSKLAALSTMKNVWNMLQDPVVDRYGYEDVGYFKVLAISAVMAEYLDAKKSKNISDYIHNFVSREYVSFNDVYEKWGSIENKTYPVHTFTEDYLMETAPDEPFYEKITPFLKRRRDVIDEMVAEITENEGVISEDRLSMVSNILYLLTKDIPLSEKQDPNAWDLMTEEEKQKELERQGEKFDEWHEENVGKSPIILGDNYIIVHDTVIPKGSKFYDTYKAIYEESQK
jgi:hypothetical protein